MLLENYDEFTAVPAVGYVAEPCDSMPYLRLTAVGRGQAGLAIRSHRARDLAADERLIVERWLGRSVPAEESIGINAYRQHAGPGTHEQQQRLRHDIVGQAREIGSRAADVSDRELDELLGEAFDHARGLVG